MLPRGESSPEQCLGAGWPTLRIWRTGFLGVALENRLVRRFELLVLFTVIALGAWLGNAREQRLALTWSISNNPDGSSGYALRVAGNQLSGPAGVRTLSDSELDQINQALDDARAWSFTFAKGGPSPALYTHAWLRRGHQSIELRWDGLASTSHMRVVDALLRSPLGPELRQCVQMARAPLEERETARRNATRIKRRLPGCRQEVLLEVDDAQRLLPLLEYSYPQVKLEAHPTMNGFYPTGPRDSILQIKNDVPNLDRIPFLQGSTSATTSDISEAYSQWRPKNSDGRFQGDPSIMKALQQSRSVTSVWSETKVAERQSSGKLAPTFYGHTSKPAVLR